MATLLGASSTLQSKAVKTVLWPHCTNDWFADKMCRHKINLLEPKKSGEQSTMHEGDNMAHMAESQDKVYRALAGHKTFPLNFPATAAAAPAPGKQCLKARRQVTCSSSSWGFTLFRDQGRNFRHYLQNQLGHCRLHLFLSPRSTFA